MTISLFWSDLIVLPGIHFEASFSRRSTHLLCPSAQGLKYQKALEWNIPVVGNDWLVDMRGSAQAPAGPTQSSVDNGGDLCIPSSLARDKGKYSAVDEEGWSFSFSFFFLIPSLAVC
jgi:hypothetical protein